MKCPRPSCSCVVDPAKAHEAEGKLYCCRTCAEVCTDDSCSCTPCDCRQAS